MGLSKDLKNKNVIDEVLEKCNIKMTTSKYNEKVEVLNEKLKSYAKENNLTFIDLNKILAPNKTLKNEYSNDDLHLNGKAYKLWTQEIKKYF